MRPSSRTIASGWLRRGYASMTREPDHANANRVRVCSRSAEAEPATAPAPVSRPRAEPIPRLGGPPPPPRLEQLIALLDRVELGGARERGLAVVLLEHIG